MCGIAGFIDFSKKTENNVLKNMILASKHRGPDDYGIEVYENQFASIGFGQSRLSIIDLSDAGHQPMHYNDFSIIFNGEIYNYKEIRNELINLGHSFKSNSDTEVILHAYEEWSYDCVHKFIGMFAFCIYDKKQNDIVIFRDRAGVKPLYYYFNNNLFLLASELKSFFEHTKFEKEIDKNVLFDYLNYGFISAPYSIFKNCYKLLPGHYLKLNLKSQTIKIDKYWDVLGYYKKDKLKIDYTTAKEELHTLFKSAFQYRMVSDVPVGVFLSGGYDSTAVTAILQSQQTEKLKTFTIGFEEGNNEAPFAKQTAEFLGTDHSEYFCTTKEAQDIISKLSFFYDEPFGDSSAIPTALVSEMAKKDVTVALSADAGDEIFCGYHSYEKLDYYLQKMNKIPVGLKNVLNKSGKSVVNLFPFIDEFSKYRVATFFDSLNKDELEQGRSLFHKMSRKPGGYINKMLKHGCSYASPYNIDFKGFKAPLEIAMAIDYQNYLQNDILTKVDRATMAYSLEGREPFLDHRIVEFAAQLPLSYKFDGVISKKILKDIVHEYVPKEKMERPKTGFSLPISNWLRGDLSYLLDEYLTKDALKWSGLFNEEFVVVEVQKFKQNKLHYTPIIWYLLTFQMWYKRWIIS